MALRHFPYQHPTFGTAKNPKTPSHWRVSVYFWWYEYLKRNEDYRKTCENDGKGKCAKLYEDFGNVHSMNFKEWWTTESRGAYLFAEPPTPSIRVLAPDDFDQQGIQQENHLLLDVPLNLPINFLVRNFRQIVSKRHSGKRGKRHNLISQALYQVKGKIDVKFLEIALMVWDDRKAEPKKPLWQIAQDIGIGGAHRITSKDTPSTIVDKKNILAATASRYFRKAEAMIQLTGKGKFPH